MEDDRNKLDPGPSDRNQPPGRQGRSRVLSRIWSKVDSWESTARIRLVVDAHPRLVALAFFFGGFVWDYLTLTRVDALFDNLLLVFYVCVVSVLGYYTMVRRAEGELPGWIQRGERWLPLAMQFGLGALLSANVIFYWQSTSFTAGAFYFVLLVALLIANEFVPHGRSPVVLLSLLFVASHSFFMFLVPVVLAQMGFVPFFIAGLLGVSLCGYIWLSLSGRGALPSKANRIGSIALVLILFVLSNVFYLTRLIPPIPLAVREIGVYHSVERADSRFSLSFEPAGRFFRQNKPSRIFHRAPGEPVYCFASVFAPKRFENEIYHAWYFFNYQTNLWEKRDEIGYTVEGGRVNGFRGFTFKRNVEPGEWRVDVETDNSRVIGRVFFEVVDAEASARDLRVRFK